ncbi:conserved Plasmodium protein, unknown function [Plasmodium berghei]|uniref:Uncharacterized protein n=2 Tax=Plasmodium berghei TaxID=5821 RepID=A0A509AEW9_PLABA|nr:conserved Plasmodium protein, unknown function [Plasmodium berghei ANKA]CXI10152.1 conserved Plasmodium protein, unknown function [Plasmodium berghei]SCL92969.1 conserved Plasmodium protein, unknown function [Plasmodium berghei]SCM15762.1 conserved Plasmodium protein, unknown function [Plasmodium berghei]SCM17557.1 conserved Plasmodium protein, unknown function [Plasmodium berghei]SCN23000.1 conserved Plasmodium protein, unknown function [Plasmodium berghei]|eukprot:XP_034420368.1 conserved Plasmodium protein, unknown function [Plasmodium berghei ANKA]
MCDNTITKEDNNSNPDLNLNEQSKNDENKENIPTGKKHIILKIKKYNSGFSGNLVMEAMKKASKFIADNERIQKEYSGVGLNNNEPASEKNNNEPASEKNNNLNYKTTVNEDKHTLSLNTIPLQKKFLLGAKAVLPGDNQELLEKLKNRKV